MNLAEQPLMNAMKNAPVSRRAMMRPTPPRRNADRATPGFTEHSALRQDEHSGSGAASRAAPLTVMALAQDSHLVPSPRSAPATARLRRLPGLYLSNSQLELYVCAPARASHANGAQGGRSEAAGKRRASRARAPSAKTDIPTAVNACEAPFHRGVTPPLSTRAFTRTPSHRGSTHRTSDRPRARCSCNVPRCAAVRFVL